jgi:hypothetical protein
MISYIFKRYAMCSGYVLRILSCTYFIATYTTVAVQRSREETCVAWQRPVNTSAITELSLGSRRNNNRKIVGGAILRGGSARRLYSEDSRPAELVQLRLRSRAELCKGGSEEIVL